MDDNVRGFAARVSIGVGIAAAWAAIATATGTANWSPQPPARAATTTQQVDPTAAAEATVNEQADALTAGWTCYSDPTGHTPSHAVVKDDGGVTAYRVTADEAWDAAHAGDVWVLNWCQR